MSLREEMELAHTEAVLTQAMSNNNDNTVDDKELTLLRTEVDKRLGERNMKNAIFFEGSRKSIPRDKEEALQDSMTLLLQELAISSVETSSSEDIESMNEVLKELPQRLSAHDQPLHPEAGSSASDVNVRKLHAQNKVLSQLLSRIISNSPENILSAVERQRCNDLMEQGMT